MRRPTNLSSLGSPCTEVSGGRKTGAAAMATPAHYHHDRGPADPRTRPPDSHASSVNALRDLLREYGDAVALARLRELSAGRAPMVAAVPRRPPGARPRPPPATAAAPSAGSRSLRVGREDVDHAQQVLGTAVSVHLVLLYLMQHSLMGLIIRWCHYAVGHQREAAGHSVGLPPSLTLSTARLWCGGADAAAPRAVAAHSGPQGDEPRAAGGLRERPLRHPEPRDPRIVRADPAHRLCRQRYARRWAGPRSATAWPAQPGHLSGMRPCAVRQTRARPLGHTSCC